MPTHSPEKTSARRPDPEDVRECHDAGMSRNRTAQVLGVSTRQVDNVAAEIGLSWSAEATAEAVAARKEHAELERMDLADSWRELAVDSVARALAEAEDAGERRRFAMTAESATRSDLSIWRGVEPEAEGEAKQAFAALLVSLRSGFETLDATPVEELDPDGEFDGPEVEEPP